MRKHIDRRRRSGGHAPRKLKKPVLPISAADSGMFSAVNEDNASQVMDAEVVRRLASGKPDESDLQVLEADLNTAQRIQNHLMPSELPKVPGYEFKSYCAPAGPLGG
ncbi:MAG: hypothetical protein ACYTAF_15375, partial [Planctomycetota bacterium]